MAVRVSRILHAGYIFECGNTQIAFDPIFENPFSRNCYAYPAVEFNAGEIQKLKLDAVFISHHHDDHCSLESLNLLDKETKIYIFCLPDGLVELIRELGFTSVQKLELGRTVVAGPFEVTAHRALDADVDSILQVKAAGLNILNVVDSWIDDEILGELAKKKWDMILWPFQTMREIEVLAPETAAPAVRELPPEWVEQLKLLAPRYVVPSSCQFQQESWSWYNHALFPITYQQFEKEIPARVIRMNPGVSFMLDSKELNAAEALNFVIPVGEQNVDYEYSPQPQTTSEIAKHFSALSSKQKKICREFCTQGLIKIYNQMETSEVFAWRLAVYDSNGVPEYFHYEIKNGIMKSTENQNYSWLTEIPEFKLYAGLVAGESLTSMYIRVKTKHPDVLCDPLICSLFAEQGFAAYQTAQLKKIKLTVSKCRQ